MLLGFLTADSNKKPASEHQPCTTQTPFLVAVGMHFVELLQTDSHFALFALQASDWQWHLLGNSVQCRHQFNITKLCLLGYVAHGIIMLIVNSTLADDLPLNDVKRSTPVLRSVTLNVHIIFLLLALLGRAGPCNECSLRNISNLSENIYTLGYNTECAID